MKDSRTRRRRSAKSPRARFWETVNKTDTCWLWTGQLTHRGLETSTYPTATFVLGQPLNLGSVPTSGQIVKVTATGQLTLHGQTKTVQIALEARLSGGVIAVTASLPIVFSDYGISPPTSFIALSVEDHGTMELQLMFTHA